MRQEKIGHTDLQVSELCLGTMTRGYQNTQAEAHAQLDYATSHGINFIDTAEIYAIPPSAETYGKTEEYIGTRLAKRGKRDDLIIASKIAGPGRDYIREGSSFEPSRIQEAVDGSLQRLQTDYIDLYQLHRPERRVPLRGKMNYDDAMRDEENQYEERIEAILQTLKKIQQTGKVRHFGLSNETSRGAMKFLQIAKAKGLPRMQSVQNAYNLLRREYEVGLAEISLQEKMGLLAYSPLAGGILTGKYQGGAKPEGARYTTWGEARMPQYMRQRCHKAVDDCIAIAQQLDISVTQLALAWVKDRSFVTSTIIGATSMDQLREDISAANITLDTTTRTKIDALWTQNPNPACW